MGVILSSKMKQLMRSYELELEDVLFAQLVADGYSQQEAAQAIYHPMGMSLTTFSRKLMEKKAGIKLLIDNIKDDMERASKRVDEMLATLDTKKKGKGKNKPIYDKDWFIGEMYIQAMRAKEGTERATILAKMADLKQIKKAEEKEEEKRLTYYLPLRCEICPWKNKDNKNV